jgi:hypothetical protein
MIDPRSIFSMIFMGSGAANFVQGIGEIIIILGSICGLAYFYFSAEHKGVFGGAAGATFGYTVMARISLLIGRLNYLIEWASALGGLFS